ncbi:MAG TPA: hypothetical protein VFO83_01945 [Aggregicoccus sp.]|nr:hypothetical protein [Aggregicoccus sp.]
MRLLLTVLLSVSLAACCRNEGQVTGTLGARAMDSGVADWCSYALRSEPREGVPVDVRFNVSTENLMLQMEFGLKGVLPEGTTRLDLPAGGEQNERVRRFFVSGANPQATGGWVEVARVDGEQLVGSARVEFVDGSAVDAHFTLCPPGAGVVPAVGGDAGDDGGDDWFSGPSGGDGLD